MKNTRFIIIIALFLLCVSCASVSTGLYIDLTDPPPDNVIQIIEPNPDYSPSFMYRIINTGIKIGGAKRVFKDNPESVVRRADNFNKTLRKRPPNSFYRSNNFSVGEIDFNGRPCFIISPVSDNAVEKAIVYLHGGGFVISIQSIHWNIIKRIVDELKIPVIVPLYPLYPETNPDNIISVVEKAFSFAYENYPDAKIIGAGDSAGAYLLLSYCHYLTNKNASRFPDKLICISPAQAVGIDEETIEAMAAIDKQDVIISIDILKTMPALYNIYFNGINWFTTPLMGDFRRFPPISVFAGTNEVFYPLIPPFVERARAHGIKIDLYVGYSMMHVWPLMPAAPESKYAMNIILDIIDSI